MGVDEFFEGDCVVFVFVLDCVVVFEVFEDVWGFWVDC